MAQPVICGAQVANGSLDGFGRFLRAASGTDGAQPFGSRIDSGGGVFQMIHEHIAVELRLVVHAVYLKNRSFGWAIRSRLRESELGRHKIELYRTAVAFVVLWRLR